MWCPCEMQVGFAAGAVTEAAALVERSRLRLRAVARMVAKERHPRVLSLESVEPLVIGEFCTCLLSNAFTLLRHTRRRQT